MEKRKPVITKSFGKFSVCAFKEKKKDGLKVYVTDGEKKLPISLLPDRDEVIDCIGRLEKIKKEIDCLSYFEYIVAGSLLISMKSDSLSRIE